MRGLALLALSTSAAAVQVDDYGALGDGAAWDHQAIQLAINVAGVNGTVEFTAGKTYVQCGSIQPLPGQRLVGNGSVLKRCDPPTATLAEDAPAGATSILLNDASRFAEELSITPVKGGGGVEDGESVIWHVVRTMAGNSLTFTNGLTQSYPAGSVVTVKFDQLYIPNLSTNVQIEGFVFDGNRTKNGFYLSWTDNKAIRGYTGMRVIGNTFRDLPGNGITVYGNDVVIDDNEFHNLNGPIAHLSGNRIADGTTINISNNRVTRTNEEAQRMTHSEGVITISAWNDAVRVVNNTVIDAPVPFIARFHADMKDWKITDNVVYGTKGIFLTTVWPGAPLEDVTWERNTFFNVGESWLFVQEGAELVEGWDFRDNRIIGGSLHMSGMRDSEVSRNMIRSCRTVTSIQGEDVLIEDNYEDRLYCPLQLTLSFEEVIDEPGGPVEFVVTVSNDFAEEDEAGVKGITVTNVLDLIGGSLECTPRLPAALKLGEMTRCSAVREVEGSIEVLNTVRAVATVSNGSEVTSYYHARVRLRDVTPPELTIIGDNPMFVTTPGGYVEPGAHAVDNRDGVLTSAIRVTGDVPLRPGKHVVTYTVSDEAGNEAVGKRLVYVFDRHIPFRLRR